MRPTAFLDWIKNAFDLLTTSTSQERPSNSLTTISRRMRQPVSRYLIKAKTNFDAYARDSRFNNYGGLIRRLDRSSTSVTTIEEKLHSKVSISLSLRMNANFQQLDHSKKRKKKAMYSVFQKKKTFCSK